MLLSMEYCRSLGLCETKDISADIRVRYNSTDAYDGPGYVGGATESNSGAVESPNSGTLEYPPQNHGSTRESEIQGNHPQSDEQPLIPDNIDPEKVVGKEEDPEHDDMEGEEDDRKPGESNEQDGPGMT